MKLSEIIKKTDLEVLTSKQNLEVEVSLGYSSDLLSDVIGNTNENDIWLTIQSHINVVAVAVMKGLAAIILVSGRDADKNMLDKAENESIVVLKTDLPAFELAGILYSMGIKGK